MSHWHHDGKPCLICARLFAKENWKVLTLHLPKPVNLTFRNDVCVDAFSIYQGKPLADFLAGKFGLLGIRYTITAFHPS